MQVKAEKEALTIFPSFLLGTGIKRKVRLNPLFSAQFLWEHSWTRKTEIVSISYIPLSLWSYEIFTPYSTVNIRDAYYLDLQEQKRVQGIWMGVKEEKTNRVKMESGSVGVEQSCLNSGKRFHLIQAEFPRGPCSKVANGERDFSMKRKPRVLCFAATQSLLTFLTTISLSIWSAHIASFISPHRPPLLQLPLSNPSLRLESLFSPPQFCSKVLFVCRHGRGKMFQMICTQPVEAGASWWGLTIDPFLRWIAKTRVLVEATTTSSADPVRESSSKSRRCLISCEWPSFWTIDRTQEDEPTLSFRIPIPLQFRQSWRSWQHPVLHREFSCSLRAHSLLPTILRNW